MRTKPQQHYVKVLVAYGLAKTQIGFFVGSTASSADIASKALRLTANLAARMPQSVGQTVSVLCRRLA